MVTIIPGHFTSDPDIFYRARVRVSAASFHAREHKTRATPRARATGAHTRLSGDPLQQLWFKT